MSRPTSSAAEVTGASWEKRGNTVWLSCPGCHGWWPVSPSLLQPNAPHVHCPRCHHEFRAVEAP